MKKHVITPSLFFQHAACPHWIWFDRYGDPAEKGEVPVLAQKLLDQGVVHEEEYIKGLDIVAVESSHPGEAFARTLDLMKEGVPLIYQGAIEAEIEGDLWRGRPDLLERVPGSSEFGDYFYRPVDIKSSHSLKREQQLQLTMYAMVLKELQGVRPSEGAIINVDQERVPFEITAEWAQKTQERVQEIIPILDGEKPPLRLSSKCKQSPWFSSCVNDAKAANDIALIYRLDGRSLAGLRAYGINTVTELAEADLRKIPKIPFAPKDRLVRAQLQARALLSDELTWLKQPKIPEATLKIYFDIEGDPLLDVQYLFGFWVVGDRDRQYAKVGTVVERGDDGYFLYFLAEQPDQEGDMWSTFLSWLKLLPKDGYQVYHYADYERARTLGMAGQYGGSEAFEAFVSRYVDLLTIVLDSVIFPLYFYSIKDIAKSKFLNYKWRHKKAGGAQSIFWYEEWIETGDRRILQDILDYNEDDVIATEYLHRWLTMNSPDA